MPASVLQTASNQNGGGSNSLVLTFAVSPIVGDLMVSAITVKGGSSTGINPPPGWDLLRRLDNVNLSMAIYTRISQSGDGATHIWTFSASVKASGGIREITGQHASTPIAVENGVINSSDTTHTTSAVTVPTGDHLVSASFGTGTGTTGTEAPGWTEGYDQATSGGPTGSRTTSQGQSRDANGESVTGSVVWGAAAVGASHIMAIASAPVPRRAVVTWAEFETPAATGPPPIDTATVAGAATSAPSITANLPATTTSGAATSTLSADATLNTGTATALATSVASVEKTNAVASATSTNLATSTLAVTASIDAATVTNGATSVLGVDASLDTQTFTGTATSESTATSDTPISTQTTTGVATSALSIAVDATTATTANPVITGMATDATADTATTTGLATSAPSITGNGTAFTLGTSLLGGPDYLTADAALAPRKVLVYWTEVETPAVPSAIPIDTTTVTDAATGVTGADASLDAQTTATVAASFLSTTATLDVGTTTDLATSATTVETIDAIASATTATPATSSVDVAASLDSTTVTDIAASSAASDASLDTQTLTTTATSEPTVTSDTPVATETTTSAAPSALSIAADVATSTTADPAITDVSLDVAVETTTVTEAATIAVDATDDTLVSSATTTGTATSAFDVVATDDPLDMAAYAAHLSITVRPTLVAMEQETVSTLLLDVRQRAVPVTLVTVSVGAPFVTMDQSVIEPTVGMIRETSQLMIVGERRERN